MALVQACYEGDMGAVKSLCAIVADVNTSLPLGIHTLQGRDYCDNIITCRV